MRAQYIHITNPMNIYGYNIYSEILEYERAWAWCEVYNNKKWAQRKVSRAQRHRRSRKAKQQRRETYLDNY